MNPESIHLLDEYYDYSNDNLAFLQKRFDRLQIKTKGEIEQNQEKPAAVVEEDEWEDCDTEDEEDVIDEEKSEGSEREGNAHSHDHEHESKEDDQYVLIRGYWYPLKDKIVDKKFIKEGLEINDNDEVVLPGGRILGHKKYAKYYKQNMVEIVKKKSELIQALAYREMGRLEKQGTVAKYQSVVKTLER